LYYKRWDLTQRSEFTLSQQTANYLKHLHEAKGGRTDVMAIFPRGSDEEKQTRALLEEYKRIARARLNIEHIDPELQGSRIIEIEQRYATPLSRPGLLISREVSGKKATVAEASATAPGAPAAPGASATARRTRFLGLEELFVYEASKNEKATQRISYFLGENAITSTLMNINDGKVPVVYVLAQNARARVVPTDGSTFFATLETMAARQNFRVAILNLTAEDAIPDDAAALVSVYPGYDFTEREMEKIRAFWERKQAALLFLLNPEYSLPRLNKFLLDYGTTVHNDRVLVASQTAAGAFKQFEVTAGFSVASPITRPLSGSIMTLRERSQSLQLELDEERQKNLTIHVLPLLEASKGYWGETRWQETLPAFDEQDYGPPHPVYLAASIERGAMREKNPALRLESNRMVIVGNPSLLDPDLVSDSSYDFISSSMNWLLNRDERLGISARKKDTYRIDLPPERTRQILGLILGVFPGVVMLFALFMWSARRA
jgi:ABC-type uncharacterized transport system